MSADIHLLPWVTRCDVGPQASSRDVLNAAIRDGVIDAVVVGRDPSGELYVAGVPSDVDVVLGLLARASQWLAAHSITAETIEPTNGEAG